MSETDAPDRFSFVVDDPDSMHRARAHEFQDVFEFVFEFAIHSPGIVKSILESSIEGICAGEDAVRYFGRRVMTKKKELGNR